MILSFFLFLLAPLSTCFLYCFRTTVVSIDHGWPSQFVARLRIYVYLNIACFISDLDLDSAQLANATLLDIASSFSFLGFIHSVATFALVMFLVHHCYTRFFNFGFTLFFLWSSLWSKLGILCMWICMPFYVFGSPISRHPSVEFQPLDSKPRSSEFSPLETKIPWCNICSISTSKIQNPMTMSLC